MRLVFALVASACALLAVVSRADGASAAPINDNGVHLSVVSHATPRVAQREISGRTGQFLIAALLLGIVAATGPKTWRRTVAPQHALFRLTQALGRTVRRRGPPLLLANP